VRRYATLLLLLLLAACMLAPACGCGEEEKASPFLESEKHLEGMYEECRTIEIDDPLGERPEIDTDQIKTMETVDVETVLVRSNGMEKPGVWTGIPLSIVLESRGVEGPFIEIRMEAWDGYIAKIPYEMVTRPDTILAWEEDGAPLPQEEGPVRLVVGSEDGFYWIHRITRMEIVR
jgi:DMSO/TMAO reductase YedYZ molybdopterin-dependent catalytic subunit